MQQRMYPDFYGSVNDGLLAATTQYQQSTDPRTNEGLFPLASEEMSIDDHLRSLPTPPPWLQDNFRHPQENEMLRIGAPKMHIPHQQTPSGNIQHMSNRCDARVPSSSDTSSSSCSPSSSDNIHNTLQNGLSLDHNTLPNLPMKQEPIDDYLPVMHQNQLLGFCSTSSVEAHPGRRNRSLTEGMLKCQYCPKKFQTPTLLENHMRDCQLIRVHECTQCGKRFKARGGLQQHMRIHNNDRPYGCHFCAKRFTQKSHVDQHERIHTGAKPFTCQYCGRAFRQRSQQMGHESTHIHTAQEIRPSIESKPIADLSSSSEQRPAANPANAVTGLLALSQQQASLPPGLMPLQQSAMLHMSDHFDHSSLLNGQIM